MNTNYVGAMSAFIVGVLALALLNRLRTPRRNRYLLASLLEAGGVLAGATVGGMFVSAPGIEGLMLRLGILAGVALPILLLATYMRRRHDRAA